jgi:hypothetical protein
MATISIDGENKIITISDSGDVIISAKEIYSRWKEWLLTNPQWEPAFRTFGGDPLGGGTFAGDFYFLNNDAGWRIAPDEKDHTLTINGNLFGENPLVSIFTTTLGGYTVNIKQNFSSLTQTVQSGSGLSAAQALQLLEIYRLHGLDQTNQLVVNKQNRTTGGINQTIEVDGEEVTVTRL